MKKFVLVLLLISLVSGSIVYLFPGPFLRPFAKFLVVDEAPRKADAVVVLNTGMGIYERLMEAADLYNKGYGCDFGQTARSPDVDRRDRCVLLDRWTDRCHRSGRIESRRKVDVCIRSDRRFCCLFSSQIVAAYRRGGNCRAANCAIL